MQVYWIWLSTRPGLRDRTRAALLEKMQDITKVYRGKAEDYAQIPELTREELQSLLDKDLTQADKILRQCATKKLRILTYLDEAYPNRLKNIPDPPAVIYYKGKLPDFDRDVGIGIVGTRKASAYGLRTARRMGEEIARCGGLVISGLAAGIDAAAMRGAFDAGKPAVGVLGCGADRIYPYENKDLFAQTGQEGCILSEFPPGTKPYKWNFPRRNRIISGLACGVLIAEAPERSGALITARQAADQGRDVFVVPGNVDSPTCVGSNALLRDGGISVTTGWELLSGYQALYPDKLREEGEKPKEKRRPKLADFLDALRSEAEVQREKEPAFARQTSQKDIDNPPPAPYIDLETTIPKLTREQQAIISQLVSGPKHLDAVIAEADLGTAQALSAVTLLEIQGILERLPGKMIGLKRE